MDVENMKDLFKPSSTNLCNTEAHVRKEVRTVFEKEPGLDMPLLGDAFVAELAEIPAVDDTSLRHRIIAALQMTNARKQWRA